MGLTYRGVQVITLHGVLALLPKCRVDAVAAAREGIYPRRVATRCHSMCQRRVVDATVVTAGYQRDPLAGERVERREGGQHVRGQAVVHERDAVPDADGGQAARQAVVAVRGLLQ